MVGKKINVFFEILRESPGIKIALEMNLIKSRILVYDR
jgi:hypothetical protein